MLSNMSSSDRSLPMHIRKSGAFPLLASMRISLSTASPLLTPCGFTSTI
uniref:Uncharacterized protein n=1 Tax=Arundo donax TaxID=35708 RepID=A0A0A9EC29_ARUDO